MCLYKHLYLYMIINTFYYVILTQKVYLRIVPYYHGRKWAFLIIKIKNFPFIFSRQHSNESVGSNPGSYAAMVASTKNGLLYQQPPSRHRPSTLPPPSHLSNLPSKMPFLNHPGNFTVHYKHFLNQKWKILQFLVL